MNESNEQSRDSQEQTKEENLKKPGALLKAAREEQGLSVDEVAKELYLTRSKLKALEHDEYDKLQSHVFIKGYLRKYAPVVGLDGEWLVDRFQKIADQMNETLEELEGKDDELPNTLVPKFVVPAALFGVAAVVLVTVFVFMGDNDDAAETTVTPASEIDAELAERVAAGASEPHSAEIEWAQATEEPNLDRELALEQQQLAAEQRADTTTSETTNRVAMPQPTAEDAPVGVAATEPTVAASHDGPELRFEFSEDCWLEVKDQFDTVIYTDIAKAGESLALQGEPPFDIALGNAQAVTLYWGDTEIDTQPRPGYRTNRLVVGDDGTTR